jgi:hypothetical protein
MRYLILLVFVASCSQPVCPKAVTKWEVLDTVMVKGRVKVSEGEMSWGAVAVDSSGVLLFGHNCTMHQVLIDNLGDSNEVVTIGSPGDMRLVKSASEVVNFMLDSMGYHLVRNCTEYSGLQ